MSDLKTSERSSARVAAQSTEQSALQTTADPFPAIVQADIRRERRLLYAELVILAVLLGLVGLRFWMAR